MARGPQTLETQLIKDARPELNGQEFRPLVYQGEVIPGYEISKDGLIISYKRYKEGKLLTWSSIGQKNMKYPGAKLSLPAELLSYVDESVASYKKGTKTIARNVKLHILVADSWLGTDDCPEDLKPWWDSFSQELKDTMRRYFHIDHIDDNKLNPHVDNLRFVSPRENHSVIKGGLQTQSENNT